MPLRAMPHYDSTTAELLVFTFKEGLLSAVAHDLKLRVTRFDAEVDLAAGKAKATIDASSLRVVCPMKDGQENRAALPAVLFGEIEKNVLASLDAKRFQQLSFEVSSLTPREVQGALTLHGVTKTVRGTRADSATQVIAEFRIDTRDFGIKPFSAMLGSLKNKPEVVVRVSVPKA
jgi:polyisoprenoid-binding protein YceI